jgi:hypothetical protein
MSYLCLVPTVCISEFEMFACYPQQIIRMKVSIFLTSRRILNFPNSSLLWTHCSLWHCYNDSLDVMNFQQNVFRTT